MSSATISDVLKLLMLKQNLKTAQLAREVALPQQTLQRIVNGVSPRPHQSSLLPLAKYFSITLDQLKGKIPIQDLVSPLHSPPGVSEVSLMPWQDIGTQEGNVANHPKIYTDANIGPNAFALEMNDSSMEPVFPKGMILIIDPDIEIKDRRYAVVKLAEHGEIMFRQVLNDGSSVYLKPLCPDLTQFQMKELTSNDQVIGILVQAKYNLIN